MMLSFLFALEQSLFTISHYCLLLIQTEHNSAALFCIGFEEICFDFKITTPSGQPEQTSDIISFEI